MKGEEVYNKLKEEGHIIFETVIGSQAYGTSLPTSDIDKVFVYMAPKEWLYSNSLLYKDVIEITEDYRGYELEKFLLMVAKNNPTSFEILFTPEHTHTIVMDPIMNMLFEKRDSLVTKLCKTAFSGYAWSQIKKAKGMEKMQNWESSRTKKKEPIDFCHFISGPESIPLSKYLSERGFDPNNVGLANIDHAPNVYGLYYSERHSYRGVFAENSTQLRFSSIPKGETMLGHIIYNKDAYSIHNSDWKRYEEWRKKANRSRWVKTENGEYIDGKNIMHLVRLTQMSREIASGSGVNVIRPNREELLSIRKGERDLDAIIEKCKREEEITNNLFDSSSLPDNVDMNMISDLMIKMRVAFFNMNKEERIKETRYHEFSIFQ